MEIDQGSTDYMFFVNSQTENKIEITKKEKGFKFKSDGFRHILNFMKIFFLYIKINIPEIKGIKIVNKSK